jgi:hypothetical protein
VVAVVDPKLTIVKYLGTKKTVRGFHIFNEIFIETFFGDDFEVSNVENGDYLILGFRG